MERGIYKLYFKWTGLLLGISALMILNACSGESTTEEIYDHLEESVTLEETFVEKQTEITELEQKEQSLYEEIFELSMDDFDKIKELSEDAISSIDERRDKVDEEKDSMDSSEKEFKKVKDLIGDLDDDKDVKENANEMYDVMMERYDAYHEIYEAYMDSLDDETELYTLLQDEDVEQEAISGQLDEINESYQHIIDTNETFNHATVEYNDLKKEFYKAADIDVEYDDEAPGKGKNDTDGNDEGNNANENDEE